MNSKTATSFPVLLGILIVSILIGAFLSKPSYNPADRTSDFKMAISENNRTANPVVRRQLSQSISSATDELQEMVGEIQDILRSTNHEPGREIRLTALLEKLVSLDPEQAAQLAEWNLTKKDREEYVDLLGQIWAARDPEKALDCALAESAGRERNAAIVSVCLKIAEGDPRNAFQMAQAYQFTQNGLVENLLQQWADKDFISAQTWVQAQPDSPERTAWMERLALVQSQVDPRDSASFVTEQIPPGPVQDEAVIAVLHQWALRDFSAAASWVDLFPPGSIRDRANKELEGVAHNPSSPN